MEEVEKCCADGFQVTLVVICRAGNGQEADIVRIVNDVNVIVLAEAYVRLFLRHSTLMKITSMSALEDVNIRLGFSPAKNPISFQELAEEMDKLALNN